MTGRISQRAPSPRYGHRPGDVPLSHVPSPVLPSEQGQIRDDHRHPDQDHGGLRPLTSPTRASPVLHFGCLARCCGRRCSSRRAVRSHGVSGRGKEEESQRGVGGGGWRGGGEGLTVPERWPCHGGGRRRGRALTSVVAAAAGNRAAITTWTLRGMSEWGGGSIPHHNRGSNAIVGTSSYVET